MFNNTRLLRYFTEQAAQSVIISHVTNVHKFTSIKNTICVCICW